MEGTTLGKHPLGRGVSCLGRRAFGALAIAWLLTISVSVARAQAARMVQVAQPATAAPQRLIPPEYRLGPGDEISITFPLNAELNHDGPIGPDGRFTMPLVGSLLLEGDTVNEATLLIANALREDRIVADARPSLTIRHYNASIYVGGEIKQPGMLTLAAGMDALQAVIAAGGLLDSARTKRVAIIRRGPDGRATITNVDLRAYLRGTGNGRMLLQPRDVVYVPKSSVAEADVWIDQYFNKLLPFGRSLNYNIGNYGSTSVVP